MTADPAPLSTRIAADLDAESADLDALLAPRSPETWARPTPAQGWSVGDTIVHLHLSDIAGLTALRDEPLLEVGAALLTPAYDGDSAGLLQRWRASRAALHGEVLRLPAGQRIPWFGPPMGAASFLTARLMETWSHGQDIADALGVRRQPTGRLRGIADLGVRTRGWSHVISGTPRHDAPVRVELVAPDGDAWTWGPGDAPDRVTGPALDFCLLVTQRRHPGDLAVTATGAAATAWLAVAQAFAGDRGSGRAPGMPAA